LLMRPDGLPMVFQLVGGREEEQRWLRLQEEVDQRGGLLLLLPGPAPHQYRNNTLNLLAATSLPLSRRREVFSVDYLIDCINSNEILPNILDYKKQEFSMNFEDYNPLDILFGYKQWTDISERLDWSRLTDAEDNVEEDVTVMQSMKTNRIALKAVKAPYRRRDQEEIVRFLVRFSAYRLVKGNAIWQKFEDLGLCNGARSWQSMKEHFRKKIILQIHGFGLTWRQVRRFRATYGLDEEHESDVETDEDEGEDSEEKEKRVDRSSSAQSADRSRPLEAEQFKPRRTSSPREVPNLNQTKDQTTQVHVSVGRRKRKLFSRNCSFLEDGNDNVFSVQPVKRQNIIAIPEIEDIGSEAENVGIEEALDILHSSNETETNPQDLPPVTRKSYFKHSDAQMMAEAETAMQGGSVREEQTRASPGRTEVEVSERAPAMPALLLDTRHHQSESIASSIEKEAGEGDAEKEGGGKTKSKSPILVDVLREQVDIDEDRNPPSSKETNASINDKNKENEDNWFTVKHKEPYSIVEDSAIVKWFLKQGGIRLKGGTEVWKKMEATKEICPGRSWYSLKERFEKHISKNLNTFGLTRDDLLRVDEYMKNCKQGFRNNSNLYTKNEDLLIIKFINDNKRFQDVKGNDLWKTMEQRNVLEDRSWQSMKERYRKTIQPNLFSYNLSCDTVAGLTQDAPSKKLKNKR